MARTGLPQRSSLDSANGKATNYHNLMVISTIFVATCRPGS